MEIKDELDNPLMGLRDKEIKKLRKAGIKVVEYYELIKNPSFKLCKIYFGEKLKGGKHENNNTTKED